MYYKKKKESTMPLLFLTMAVLTVGMGLGIWADQKGNGNLLCRVLHSVVLPADAGITIAFLQLALTALLLWSFGFWQMGLPFIYALLLWVGLGWGHTLFLQLTTDVMESLVQLSKNCLLPAGMQLPVWCVLGTKAQSMALELFRVKKGRAGLKREDERRNTEYLLVFLGIIVFLGISLAITSKVG